MSHTIEEFTRALDEIYVLRLLLAREARVLEAHLELKSSPKSRRRFAEESVERMRDAARGHAVLDDSRSARAEYRRVTGSETMTVWQWREEQS